MGEVKGCWRRLVIQAEEATNDCISVLEQATLAGRAPPRTSVSCLHSRPQAQLHSHKPREEQRQERGRPPSGEEPENRHWRSFFVCVCVKNHNQVLTAGRQIAPEMVQAGIFQYLFKCSKIEVNVLV